MTRTLGMRCALLAAIAAVLLTAPGVSVAQVDLLQLDASQPADVAAGLGPLGGDPVMTVTAEFTASDGDLPARLYITAKVAFGWHVYSITQKSGGPIRTKIALEPSDDYRLVGEFIATPPPERQVEPLFDDLLVESHEGTVTWYAPIELAAGVDPASLEINGRVVAQACNATGCLPPDDFAFTARLGAGVDAAGLEVAAEPDAVGEYRHASAYVVIRGHAEPQTAAPGSIVAIKITAEPQPGWHVYALADRDPQHISKPTLITVAPPAGWKATRAEPDNPPREKPSELEPGTVERFYEAPVTWTLTLQVPDDAAPGTQARVAGIVGYHTCTDTSCDQPRGVRFAVDLPIAASPVAGERPLAFYEAGYADAASAAESYATQLAAAAPGRISADVANQSAALVLGAALLGGFLLNFMPCVLPVIGLKILSFVEQSGHERGRVLWLNLWYAVGLISVFLVLASLAVFLNLGWGQQFQSQRFNIVMAGLVFVMALSFLGVWEIPIPGFVGGTNASKLQQAEGVQGAFMKGVLATVLATPCSGPFLGPVFGFTLTQPAWMIYAIFTFVGLGMAAPYLVIGAFPGLIRFLPRPGVWMDTFKQLMGFVLLGTVVFLMSFISKDYVVALAGVLLGLGLACWWIGRVPITAGPAQQLRGWATAGLLAAAVSFVSIEYLTPREELLPWQPFSTAKLTQLTSSGSTVMVDFTADWCLTCQANEEFVLNTADVYQAVESNGVVVLKADWTEPSDEIKETLASLGSKSIPLLAIYPAGRPGEPIVLRDVISKQQVLDALEQAGPSQPGTEAIAGGDRSPGRAL